jgi:hypothetical protein
MTANERYEKAWDSFLVYLNRNPKAQLTPFLKERHVNHRTMMNWMCEKGYSVLRTKKEIRQAQEAARREKAEASASSTGIVLYRMNCYY